MAQEMVLTLGSSSAILVCGLARLGVPVTFISKVGRDDFGKFCLDALESKKVKTDNVIRDAKLRTGLTVSLNFREDKAQVTYPGLFHICTTRDIPPKTLRQVTPPCFFVLSSDGLLSSFPQLFRTRSSSACLRRWTPIAMARNQWNSGIWKCLEYVDLLLLNEMGQSNIAKAKSVNRALEIFAQRFLRLLSSWAQRVPRQKQGRSFQLPAFKMKPIDSTGAGDSFDAGFLFSHLSSFDLRKSLPSPILRCPLDCRVGRHNHSGRLG